jgi:hypothetical protein
MAGESCATKLVAMRTPEHLAWGFCRSTVCQLWASAMNGASLLLRVTTHCLPACPPAGAVVVVAGKPSSASIAQPLLLAASALVAVAMALA